MAWYIYLIECEDGSIYTGIAVNVAKRYADHCAGIGAKYTRSHKPKRLLARFAAADRSAASRAEYAIKQLSSAQKRKLASGDSSPLASSAVAALFSFCVD